MSSKMHTEGIKNIRLLLGITNETGDLIIKAVDKHSIDFCCIGRRGMGKLKRLFMGSVSSYVVEHANCSVFVVKGEHGPQIAHDKTLASIKQSEEVERFRRIREHKKEIEDENERRKFDSKINKNITIVSEEQERRRRVQEEKNFVNKEEERRIAEKIGVIRDEEEERSRRLEEEREGKQPRKLSVELFPTDKD